MHKSGQGLRRAIPLLIVLAAIAGGYYWWRTHSSTAGSNVVSGTIEATEVTISAESNGRAVAVHVAEGDVVDAGQELVAFDTALLDAQRKRGAGDVIVLGEELGALLAGGVERPGLVLACAPSLAAMLADPAAKRACWAAVRHLRRESR